MAARILERAGVKTESGEVCSCGRLTWGAEDVFVAAPDGYIRGDKALPGECRECAEARIKRDADEHHHKKLRADMLQDANLGRRLEQAKANYVVATHNRDAHEKVVAWLEAPTGNLIIVGPIGSGKSYLAAWAFLTLLERMTDADVLKWPITAPRWVSVPRLFAAIRQGYSCDDARRQSEALISDAQRAPVLFLDDCGKAHSQNLSWVEETLYQIVDPRYSDELPTVVTTEYTGAALRDRVGESVVTRLEHGAVVAGIKRPSTPYRRPR